MNSPLRIAIAGGGKMARHHAAAIGQSNVAGDVVAFADPDPGIRKELQSLAPEADIYAEIDDLLDESGVDVVHVCTPPATHTLLARKALEAGCHVYVEKPFAASISEAREILGLARELGLKATAGHQVLFQPAARRARELRSALGTPTHVESYFSFHPSRGRGDGSVPLRADEQLLDVLPHPVYLMLEALADEATSGTRVETIDVDRGPGGTVHAQIRMGPTTGHLVVTLEGRPVENYLRMVGTRGSVHADFVRDTVQHQLGPGKSAIDKVLAPYRTATQLATGTTGALLNRLFKRNRGYPGLAEAVEEFHRSIVQSSSSPLSDEHILGTVTVCEAIAEVIQSPPASPDESDKWTASVRPASSPGGLVAVTGGTGFLGDALVARLVERGVPVRVICRRLPAPWSRRSAVDYRSEDLGGSPDPKIFEGVEVVVHCAAETSGGWGAHRRNSIEATENVIRLARAAEVSGVLHVSSVAVLEEPDNGVLSENTPLRSDTRSSGPYVWGKLKSERRARRMGEEHGLEVKVVRPGAIVDFQDFDPPGRLGRRMANVFVAVGGLDEPLDAVSRTLAAETLARMATAFEEAPDQLNLIEPEPLTRGDALRRLKATNPSVRILRLPRLLFRPLAWAAVLGQRILRPGTQPVDPAVAFGSRRYDTRRLEAYIDATSAAAEASVQGSDSDGREVPSTPVGSS